MQERNAKARAGASKPFPFGVVMGRRTRQVATARDGMGRVGHEGRSGFAISRRSDTCHEQAGFYQVCMQSRDKNGMGDRGVYQSIYPEVAS
ncbi:hypothetical protein M8818_003193 [Zalaria obscura]|uniref:Uncharacterized protein n=1 Tax=Zalaria obscura TaxID=2024903 RepID=A0ACC3SFA6_9PEZI